MASSAYESPWTNDEVRMFRRTVRQFIEKEFAPHRARWRPEYFRRRRQVWQRLVKQLERFGNHGRELLSRSCSERRRYLVTELRERKARRAEERAAALDPVLARRAKVERASLSAVCGYSPRRFPGHLKLFLACSQWLSSGVAALRWRAVGERAEEYFGPEASGGSGMLREPHAAAFAELFRRSCQNGGE